MPAALPARTPPQSQLAVSQRQVRRLEGRLAASEKEVEHANAVVERYKSSTVELANRYQGAATYAVGGFGLGAALVYFFHDDVTAFFGPGSIVGQLVLPAVGAAATYYGARGRALKDPASKPGAHLDDRMGLMGLGMGLMLTGGYFSYQTWPK